MSHAGDVTADGYGVRHVSPDGFCVCMCSDCKSYDACLCRLCSCKGREPGEAA